MNNIALLAVLIFFTILITIFKSKINMIKSDNPLDLEIDKIKNKLDDNLPLTDIEINILMQDKHNKILIKLLKGIFVLLLIIAIYFILKISIAIISISLGLKAYNEINSLLQSLF